MKHNLPPVIFFDLDDTLIAFDSVVAPALEKCANDFCERYAPGFTKAELIDARKKAGNWYWSDPARAKAGRENMRQARRDVFRLTFESLGVTDTRLADEVADYYTACHYDLICPFPRTVPTLEALRARGVRMALITNGASEGQREKLKRFDLERFFEAVLISQEAGFDKPDPRIFLRALERMDVPAADAWMVGDSLAWDVAGARAAGIFAVWNDYRKAGLPTDAAVVPDRIVSEIAELLEM